MGTSRSVCGKQLNLDVSSGVVTLTRPDAAQCASVFVRPTNDSGAAVGAVSFTTDGTTPTANIGIIAYTGDIINLNSRDELDKFRVIRQTGTDAEIDIIYYTNLAG